MFRGAAGGGGVGLVVNTLDPGSRNLGLELCCVLEQDMFTSPPPKVLIITRKRWLRPNMTEKLFTVTFSIKSYHIYGNILTLMH